MIRSSSCPPWRPEPTSDPTEDRRSYTTPGDVTCLDSTPRIRMDLTLGCRLQGSALQMCCSVVLVHRCIISERRNGVHAAFCGSVFETMFGERRDRNATKKLVFQNR